MDSHGGRSDLSAGLIRAIGDPVERFTEDGLRPSAPSGSPASWDTASTRPPWRRYPGPWTSSARSRWSGSGTS
ncbi:MAG: hypothetical protein MZU97_07945 [Bacillus subtilis]|nr:hypothetical protein [Bacillus subtilis]